MQNNLNKTRNKLAATVASQIDKASFRQCYERNDPAIERFIVIAADACLADVGVRLRLNASALDELFANGQAVGIIGPLHEYLTGPAELKRNLRDYLAPRLDQEVRALYLPPYYLVQFTGKPWE